MAVLDAAGAVLSDALGLFSCVSCAFPIFVSLSSGDFGGSSAVVGAIMTDSTDLSTVVILVALALLYYRPTQRPQAEPRTAARPPTGAAGGFLAVSTGPEAIIS